MAQSEDSAKLAYEQQLRDLSETTMGDLIANLAMSNETESGTTTTVTPTSTNSNELHHNSTNKSSGELLDPGQLGQREISIPVPWGHIAAKTWGNPVTGKRVLAVHGWMDNCGTFDRLIPLLPQSLYIVAIDVPGHGRSSHLPAGITYHYIDFITAIRRVINFLQWDKKKFSYLGHSMGASLGIVLISIYPTLVDRFVSLDLILPLTDSSEEIPGKLASGVRMFLVMDELEQKETAQPPAYYLFEAVDRLMKFTLYSEYPLTNEAAKTLLIRGTRPSETNPGKVVFTRDQRLNTANFLRFTPETMLSMIKNISCHMLIIRAHHSISVGPTGKAIRDKAINIYDQKCASFKLIEVPGNHFVHLNEPDVVANHVAQFLNSSN